MKNILALIVIVFLAASCTEPKTETPTAKQILDRMVTVYSSCQSYRDSGTVKTLFIQVDGNKTSETSFATVFARPGRIRFEFKEKHDNQAYHYLVWANGKDVRTWRNFKPGIERPISLRFALAGATGVSDGAARRIPPLLIPTPVGAGWDIRDLGNVKRLEDAKTENVDCFRIQGETGINNQGPVILLIDKSTFLVRRIDEQGKLENFEIKTSTNYKPIVNGEISDKMLEFDPAE